MDFLQKIFFFLNYLNNVKIKKIKIKIIELINDREKQKRFFNELNFLQVMVKHEKAPPLIYFTDESSIGIY